MKKVIKKTIGFLVLAVSMQLLTASTGKNNCTPAKSTTTATKQVKLKTNSRLKTQMPLFETLLKHF